MADRPQGIGNAGAGHARATFCRHSSEARCQACTPKILGLSFIVNIISPKLVCPRCQGRMRLVAVVKDPDAIGAILAHPAHRDDDPQSGPDPPQLPLDLKPQPDLFESV